MCDITLFIENLYERYKKATKLAKNNANFVTTIIITRENGGEGGQAEV